MRNVSFGGSFMQITLIRHLPTDWNKKSWLQGRKDITLSPLTDNDKKGILYNQELLKTLIPFDIILTSTLIRTQQTAKLYGYQPVIEPLLDELDFGQYEGQSKEKLLEELGENWIENPLEIVLGESIKNVEKRIKYFLNRYKTYSNILIFGHGAWIRAMLSYYHYGHINHMNKMIVNNNECFTISINSEGRNGGKNIVCRTNL